MLGVVSSNTSANHSDKEDGLKKQKEEEAAAVVSQAIENDHAASRPRDDVKIVSIDLQPISPLAGITTLRADITHPATVPLLLNALDPDHKDDAGVGSNGTTTGSAASSQRPVDLVLSDGAPDVTGLHDLDIYVQSQLLFAALNLALCVLRPGGKFVAKIFRGRNVDVLYAQLKIFFETVVVAKPRSSRASSVEAFIVCLNFQPPPGFKASLEEPLGVGERLGKLVEEHKKQHQGDATAEDDEYTTVVEREVYDDVDGDGDEEMMETATTDKSKRWIAPFVACGDLSAFDSDASYTLPEDYVSLDPVQPPIAPPYKRAIEMRAALSKAAK